MYRIRENISSFFTQLLNYHSQCELCLEAVGFTPFLCRRCYSSLSTPEPACSQCSEPIPATLSTQNQIRCGRCQKSPPAFDYSHCHFLYAPPVSSWLHQLKDKRQFIWCNKLSTLMLKQPPKTLAVVDGLVFIPSSFGRTIKRGFNTAELLAYNLSRSTGIPVITNALIKLPAKDQRTLSRAQRKQNLRHSLRAGNLDLSAQHLLIVDDVMTTGATMDVAARCLKSQGAKIVGGWAFARTPPPQQYSSG